MEIEVDPEPGEEERAALLEALDEPEESEASGWRRAALREAVEESAP